MNTSKYDISVIIPVYNVVEYLEQAIESIMIQMNSIVKIEILIIDDGSNDGSEKICDKYSKYENITVIHKENEGQGVARNIGIDRSQGKYIYFLDSDDYIEPNTLASLYNLAEKENLDVICFTANIFYDSLGLTDTFARVYELGFQDSSFIGEIHTGIDTFIYLIENNEYLTSAPRRFFKTEFIKNNKIYFPSNIIHEDEIFGFFSMVQSERTLCIQDKFYNRRVRPNSTMTGKNNVRSAEGYMYTWKRINDYLKEVHWEREKLKVGYKFCGNFLLTTFNMYCMSSRKEKIFLNKLLEKYNDSILENIRNYNIPISLFIKYRYIYMILYRGYKLVNRK